MNQMNQMNPNANLPSNYVPTVWNNHPTEDGGFDANGVMFMSWKRIWEFKRMETHKLWNELEALFKAAYCSPLHEGAWYVKECFEPQIKYITTIINQRKIGVELELKKKHLM